MNKRKNSVGYFSAYYRGLECLLKMWPAIRRQVPDATLDIYYGWQSWVAFQGEDDLFRRINKMLEELKDQGVTEHGRVSHTELAQAMQTIQVWAYPTEFEEIHCITALKAQEARCWPVVTAVGALVETVQSGDVIKTKEIYTDDYNQANFIDAVARALKEGKEGTPVPETDWSTVARRWESTIQQKIKEGDTPPQG